MGFKETSGFSYHFYGFGFPDSGKPLREYLSCTLVTLCLRAAAGSRHSMAVCFHYSNLLYISLRIQHTDKDFFKKFTKNVKIYIYHLKI